MKKSIDIKLTTIHAGGCRSVVTLGIEGIDQAQEFLEDLAQQNGAAFKKLVTRMRIASELDRYENESSFKSLAGGLFEFKVHRPAIRLYAFHDDLDEDKLIIAACGGGKGSQKHDIKKARDLRAAYLTAKKSPNTTIDIIEEET